MFSFIPALPYAQEVHTLSGCSLTVRLIYSSRSSGSGSLKNLIVLLNSIALPDLAGWSAVRTVWIRGH